METVGIFILMIIGLIIFILIAVLSLRNRDYESPIAWAGKQGEREAAEIIKEILQENDILLTNVYICHDGKETELDNVIINNNGIFIIEVKNYSGTLVGEENDYEWTKYKISSGGNTYIKQVRNPVRQVKRQVYILSQYLKYYNIRAWIDGYVLLLNHNSPLYSSMILESQEEIDHVIHERPYNLLNQKTVHAVKELLL